MRNRNRIRVGAGLEALEDRVVPSPVVIAPTGSGGTLTNPAVVITGEVVFEDGQIDNEASGGTVTNPNRTVRI